MDAKLKDLLTENTVEIVQKIQFSMFTTHLVNNEVLPKHVIEMIFKGWQSNTERVQMMLIELKKSANNEPYRKFILALVDAGYLGIVKALQPNFTDGQTLPSNDVESNNNQILMPPSQPIPPQTLFPSQVGSLIQPAIYNHVPSTVSSSSTQMSPNATEMHPNGLNGSRISPNSVTPGYLCIGGDSPSPTSSQNGSSMEVDSSQSGTVAEYDVVQQIEIQIAPVFIISSENYKMTSKVKGHCLIINNVDFTSNPLKLPMMGTRHGSDHDATLLSKLFQQLGYKICLYKNVVAKGPNGMKVLLQTFATQTDHSAVDSAVIIVLSHGNSGDLIYGTDGETISMKCILKIFNNENCPTLLGKPKMFFIQACRGDQVDRGVDTDCVHDSPAGPDVHMVSLTRRDSMEDKIPRTSTWSDMMIAYSTCPGYVSIRNSHLGSWFCQAVVKVFMTRAHNTHIQDMMNLVCAEMTRYTTSCGEKQAVEVVYRSWIKKLNFNPGKYIE